MKLITFDWDQTLWNSWDVHVEAAQYAAGRRDLPIPDKEWIASTFSEPFARHMELIFPHDTREATKHYMEYYHSRVKVLGHLFDGVPRLLESLKDRGFVLALLSDKVQVYGTQELNATSIALHFDVVLFRDGARQYKPNPEGLQQVI